MPDINATPATRRFSIHTAMSHWDTPQITWHIPTVLLKLHGDVMKDRSPARHSPPHAQQRPSMRHRGGRRVHRTTVLVVDDEAAVRETMAEALSLYGYHVVPAASIEEAEAAIQRLGFEGIHLVITDVHLTPEPQARAGYALAQRWRTQEPGLPFILISGDPSIQDMPDVRAGMIRFLLKPFRIEAFLEAVQQALS